MRLVRLLVVALALSLASAATAATYDAGVLAGFNFSNLRIQDRSSIEGRSTFAAGGVVDIGINDRFGIRIEPTWLSKGAKATKRNAYWGTIDGVVFKLDYVDVPVLARYDFETADIHPYGLAGVGVSFATKQEAELTQGQNSETIDFSDVFKPVDVSLHLGAGISFPLGGNRLTIDGRGAIGLININDGGTITFAGSPLAVPSTSTHTLDFHLFATYLFAL